MISAGQWAAYNAAVESIRQGASSAVEAEVSAWCAAHAGASMEEARDAAKAILSGRAQAYDKAAAALAAEWYDAQGRAAGMKLDRAVTAATYDAGGVDKAVRYQVRRYAEGDIAGFAAMCGEYAANDATRSVNKTILKNVGRDRKRGVKFARVTSGRNTCAFCLMLAGRGAVYHSRKSAGEMNRYHRHCTCKVVPCYSGDQHEVLVEGHDPKDAKRWSDRVEAAKKSGRLIPGFPSDAEAEEAALGLTLDGAWAAHLKDGGDVDSYREHYAKVISSAVPENPIEIEDFTKLEGKELQEAIWAARAGHSVRFRNPNDHKDADGNTSDTIFDGITCDFKKVSSPKIKKAVREITSKLDRQGPAFLLDITGSRITEDQALVRMAELLDDQRIETIYIVKKGRILQLKK